MNIKNHQKFKTKSVFFTSLGCSKNLVDSQVMLGHLGLDGYQMVKDPKDAEIIVINTCSFVADAKQESIDTILEMAEYKDPTKGSCQALVIAGCMAQRYSMALEEEIPEADLIIGTGEYHKISILLKAWEQGQLEKKSFIEIPRFIHTEFDPRLNTSPFYMGWLKISEGCNRNCTFCIIPTIRGRLRSRTVHSLIEEAKNLSSTGVKELNLISQDLSDYGSDLDKENNLLALLDGLEKIEGVEWIRLFYFYPDDLTDEVIEKIASSKKICSYLDMPVQHFSDSVLKRMNRNITGNQIKEKIKKLRHKIPDIVLRTSIIVGFPGETQQDFQILLDGVKEIGFDHLGVFKYSDEEGTPAFKLGPKTEESVIQERFEELYEYQKEIIRQKNSNLIGKTIKVLVEGEHEETPLLIQGRHQGQGPEIDGKIIINDTPISLERGQFYNVCISEVLDYDLVGSVVLN